MEIERFVARVTSWAGRGVSTNPVQSSVLARPNHILASGRSTVTSELFVRWVNQFAVPPSLPGGTRHFDFGAELVRLGHQVEVVASDLHLGSRVFTRRQTAFDLRPLSETPFGVGFVWLWAVPYDKNDWRRAASMVSFGLGTFFHLVLRRRSRGEVVIGSTPHLLGAGSAWLAARLRRVPFVLEVRDLWPETFVALTGNSTGAQVRLMRWIADHLYRGADAIIVLAADSAAVIKSRGARCPVEFIPNSVSLATFERAELRRAEGSRCVFVYAGAHGPANGLDGVIRACAELRDRGCSDIQVHLVGDGPAKKGLQDLALRLGSNNVHFQDPVPKLAMPELLRQFDAALMILAPVELFSFAVSPNKLFDYLAADLPVVNNVPGFVASVIAEAGAGISCSPGDPIALAEAMQEMADQLGSDRNRYRTGRRYVEARYNRRTLATTLESLLDEARSATARRSSLVRGSRCVADPVKGRPRGH